MASGVANVLRSLLIINEESFFIGNNGEKVPADVLEGKIVGIYFLSRSLPSSEEFTNNLKGIYNKLKDKGEMFEIVSAIFHEEDQQSFNQSTEDLPWLVLPFQDERVDTLVGHFTLRSFPMLAIVGKNGETIRSDVSYFIQDYGIDAYPFSSEKLAEFDAVEEAKLNAQTLESLLVDGEDDFVISKDGMKVPVMELVGKTILFYFSSNLCPPCQRFKSKLIELYYEIKAKDTAFDLIFISSDKDQTTFDEPYSNMPWLTLPFRDQRAKSLWRKLKVSQIPTLVAVGQNGRTITYNAKELLMAFGSDAYPFDEEKLKEIVDCLPRRLNTELHQEHELKLSPRDVYFCGVCLVEGFGWSFCCEGCEFYVHPKCALVKNKWKGDDSGKSKDHINDGWICNDQVCYSA